jgi:hypothetical protein
MKLPEGAIPIHDLSLVGDPVELEVIDASADPEYATARSEAVLDSLNQRPEIEQAPDGAVHLPAGWVDPSGRLHSTAVVRELRGIDEERLGRINMREQMPLWIRTLVECGVEYIGDAPATPEILGQLLIGDREQLSLEIAIATYGDELPMEVVCPFCLKRQEVALELRKDIEVKNLTPPDKRLFDIELMSGKHATVTLPTAALQDEITADRERNTAEAITLTLENCIKKLDGTPPNHHMVLNLSMRDRKTIADFLSDTQPGPDYEGVSVPCSCGRDVPIRLSVVDLFRL